jgi:hypothetical protein
MKKIILKSGILILLTATLLLGACDGIIEMGRQLPSGTPLWARSAVGGTAASNFNDVAVGSDGVYAVGSMGQGTLDLGNGVTVTATKGSANLIIAKYNYAGLPLWIKIPHTNGGTSSFTKIVITSNSFYVLGVSTCSTIDFGNSITISSNMKSWPFIAKYNLTGTPLWAITTSPSNWNYMYSLTQDKNGIYAVGRLTGPGGIDFGNSIKLYITSDTIQGFIVKYNSEGLAEWAKTIISGPGSCFNSVTVGDDAVYTAGYIIGGSLVDFGDSVTVTGPENQDPVIVKYDFEGKAQWAATTKYHGPKGSEYKDIKYKNGALFAVGSIGGNEAFFFSDTVIVKGSDIDTNCVMVKYNTNGVPQWARSVTSGSSATVFNYVSATDDNVYVSGFLCGFMTYNFGNGISIDALSGRNPILLKYDKNGSALWARSILPPAPVSGFCDFQGNMVFGNKLYITGSVPNEISSFGDTVPVYGGANIRNLLLITYIN